MGGVCCGGKANNVRRAENTKDQGEGKRVKSLPNEDINLRLTTNPIMTEENVEPKATHK